MDGHPGLPPHIEAGGRTNPAYRSAHRHHLADLEKGLQRRATFTCGPNRSQFQRKFSCQNAPDGVRGDQGRSPGSPRRRRGSACVARTGTSLEDRPSAPPGPWRPSKAEAALDAFLDEIEAGSNSGVRVARRPFTDVFSAYIDVCRTNAKLGTIESYEHTLKRLPETLKTMDVKQVTAHDLDSLYATMRETRDTPPSLSVNAGRDPAVLHPGAAVSRTATNPAGASRPLRDAAPEKRIASPAEVFQLVVAAITPKEKGGRGNTVLAIAVFLAAVTGCRRGELCGLRWDDLDAATNSIASSGSGFQAKAGSAWTPQIQRRLPHRLRGPGSDRRPRPIPHAATRSPRPLARRLAPVLRRWSHAAAGEDPHRVDRPPRRPRRSHRDHDAQLPPYDRVRARRRRSRRGLGCRPHGQHDPGHAGPLRALYDDRSVAAAGMLHERLKAQGLPIGELLSAEPAVIP